jgi:hypothetical protein
VTTYVFRVPVPFGKEYDDLIQDAMKNGYGWEPDCWPSAHGWRDLRIEAESLGEAEKIFKEWFK